MLKSLSLLTILAALNLSHFTLSYRGQYAVPYSELPRTLEEYTETTVTTIDENGDQTTETTTDGSIESSTDNS